MCQNRPFIFVEVCESLEVYMYESTTLLERTIAVCWQQISVLAKTLIADNQRAQSAWTAYATNNQLATLHNILKEQ